MNWRLATLLNTGIAAVTLVAVIFDLSRGRAEPRSAKANHPGETAQVEARRKLSRLVGPGDDLTQMRVDDLAVIPPAELYDVLLRATPEQIAEIALRFNNLPNNSYFTGSALMFFQAWAELDPIHALEGSFRLKDIALRQSAATTVIGSASPAAASEMAKLLRDSPDKDLKADCSGAFMETLLERWAWVDPSAAARFFGDLDNSQISSPGSAAQKIAYGWGNLDPNGALAWIAQQEKSGRDDAATLLNCVVTGWFSSDPAAAITYITAHFDQPGIGPASSVIANTLFQRDPEAAVRFLQKLPTGDSKATIEDYVGQTWITTDPGAAVHWLEGLPGGEQKAVVGPVVATWVQRDWPAASKWVDGLSGEIRDQAVAAAAINAPFELSPDEYLPLVLSINDDRTRAEALGNVIQQWGQRDPDAVVAWVKSSGLPKDQKQEILARPELSKQQ